MKKQRHFKYRAAATLLLAVVLGVASLAGCASGKAASNNSKQAATDAPSSKGVLKTADVQGADITVTSWVSEKRPDENVSSEKDLSYIDVGLGKKGGQSRGLVRFDLPSGVTPNDLVSAQLFMKKNGGDEPMVKAGTVSVPWGYATATWNEIEGKADFRDGAQVFKKCEGDWYSLDVTDIVREWFAGEKDNYGFVLEGAEQGKTTSFVSAYSDAAADYPWLSVSYHENKPSAKYGKYGYTEQPDEAGNCLSYALRDKNDIYEDDLIPAADKKAFRAALANGQSEALAYLKDKVSAYIDAHKEKLAIESWRPLSGFDEPIDPEKEYMVAMKIGIHGPEEDNASGSAFDGFDFHFRARLDDGRWAEKVPHTASRITPGSNEAFDTGKYPWDSDFQWGNVKWMDYYDSPALYFAVTKSTDEFTSHKQ